MITVEARILKNDMLIKVDDDEYIALPCGWNLRGTIATIKRLFTLKYEVYDKDKKNRLSVVSYDDIHDSIIIYQGETKISTKSRGFKPSILEYMNEKYEVHEKMTGLIYITKDGEIVATGICGFKTVKFAKYESKLTALLRDLAVGYCIKILTLKMFTGGL
ncbi:MAG: hypothetical protein ACP5JR_02760 [Thermoplasmata archaeon]